MLTVPDALLISISARRVKQTPSAARPSASLSAARGLAALAKLAAIIEEVCPTLDLVKRQRALTQAYQTNPPQAQCHVLVSVCIRSRLAPQSGCGTHMQVNMRAPELGIRSQLSTAAAEQQLPPPSSLWAAGHCTGLQLVLDTRRPLGQRTSIAGKFRRSIGGGGPEEAQLLQARPFLRGTAGRCKCCVAEVSPKGVGHAGVCRHCAGDRRFLLALRAFVC